MRPTATLIFLLLLITTAWAAEQPCVICSVEQSRLHTEQCDFSSSFEGETYYFCNANCEKRFHEGPAEWAERFAALDRTPPPTAGKLPKFKLPLEPIGSVSSADIEGKVVVLNYWASWCAPCMKEMPDLVALQDKFGPRGLTVLAFSFDKTRAAHQETAQKLGLNFPSFYAKAPEVKAFLDKLGPVEAIPVTLVVDGDGKIVNRILRPTTLEELTEIVQPLLPTEEVGKVSRAETKGSVVPS